MDDRTIKSGRRTFLSAAGAGAGVAITLVIAFAGWSFIEQLPRSPKQWNPNAITCISASYVITPAERIDIELKYKLSNNTAKDYRLPAYEDHLFVVSRDGSLENRDIRWDTLKLIPAKRVVAITVRLKVDYNSSYTPSERDNMDKMAAFLSKNLSDIRGFRIIDTENRYEIDLFLPEFRELKPLD